MATQVPTRDEFDQIALRSARRHRETIQPQLDAAINALAHGDLESATELSTIMLAEVTVMVAACRVLNSLSRERHAMDELGERRG